ncbi:hypothetical protein, partial [Enterobacter hormaechei]|uniref:hypothetical protein n=1 Tax=Enterobacter hormaechei TaxID=158836 RepID=UPI0013FE4AB4
RVDIDASFTAQHGRGRQPGAGIGRLQGIELSLGEVPASASARFDNVWRWLASMADSMAARYVSISTPPSPRSTAAGGSQAPGLADCRASS